MVLNWTWICLTIKIDLFALNQPKWSLTVAAVFYAFHQ